MLYLASMHYKNIHSFSRFTDSGLPMIADTQGKAVIVTRYFRKTSPPEIVLRERRESEGAGTGGERSPNEQAERVAWFVSNVPYMAKNAMFPGLQEIWPNSSDFLNLLGGSEAEHAVLLTNYFSGIGKTAYLVFGQARLFCFQKQVLFNNYLTLFLQGVPEGDTCYVLTVEESGDQLLWNPVTGESFNALATFCPLQSVYAVVNESTKYYIINYPSTGEHDFFPSIAANMWGNLQPTSAPSRLRWDLSRSSDWLSLLGRGGGGGGEGAATSSSLPPSIQPHQLPCSAPDTRAALALKDRLERR